MQSFLPRKRQFFLQMEAYSFTQCTTDFLQNDTNANAVDLNSGSTWFEPRLRHDGTEVYRYPAKAIQANISVIPQI